MKKYKDLAEIFEDILNVKRENPKNKNVIVTCKITKKQAQQGLSKTINIDVADVCNNCKGTGKKTEYKCNICNDKGIIAEDKHTILGTIQTKRICSNCQCEECKGKGYVYNKRDITVKIPPKTKNNDYIIFKTGNQERGKIFVKIHIFGDRSKRKGKMIYEL